MMIWKVVVTALVWLIIGAIVCWNGAGWILGKTSIEFLQDEAVRMIIQIIAVVAGAGTFAGVGTWLTMLLMAVLDNK